jgi:hypothetical protein
MARGKIYRAEIIQWIRTENGDVDLIPYRHITERQKEETYSDMCCVLKRTLLKWTPLKKELFPVQLYLRCSSSGRTKELGYRLSVFSDWHPMIDPLLF